MFKSNHLLKEASENDLSDHIHHNMAKTNMQEDWRDQSPDLVILLDLVRILIE